MVCGLVWVEEQGAQTSMVGGLQAAVRDAEEEADSHIGDNTREDGDAAAVAVAARKHHVPHTCCRKPYVPLKP